ncbi:SEC23-interacting protein isoform X2 [Belonocnema kinseyi]|uniref:SEC23-interacting protein isoform X2 n=1 Tax=Belonocnema kinseyi TaxID=2817044 RepID=UPI00143D2E62|nr:SEC23-interacting protein isoform X2 [Belonocnema kinseyi]
MSDTVRKVQNPKNPLLSAAGQGFPFENFAENALLMPVTPATPAVLSDDAELEGLSGPNLINPSPATINATVDYTSGNPLVPTSLPEVSKESNNQPQKQGYFTSILSSLPNLSLSAIKGESHKAQEYQEPQEAQYVDPYLQNPYGSPSGPRSFLATNPYDSHLSTQPSPFESSPAPPQQVPPPTTLPPSGGPGSYRLGNQRRLKYAPPPDLTSSAPKQYQVPSSQPFSPQTSALPPHFLNPNVPVQTENYSHQVSTGPSSGPGSSIQSPFSNSPVVTPFSSTANLQTFNQTPTYSLNAPPRIGSFASSPENIPGRFPETLTPQNTPAATSYPGFSAYEKQSSFGFSGTGISYPASAFNSIHTEERKEPPTITTDEKTFTPISAAKVSQKLENFIAEQEEEFLTQKLNDFSSEVSDITSQILLKETKTPEEPRELKKTVGNFDGNQNREKTVEPLTEIDLNAPLSEIPLSGVDGKDPNVNPSSTFSAVSFFSEGNANQNSSLNQLPPAEGPEFPTFYNPLDYQNQNTSTLLAVSLASVQHQSFHTEGSTSNSTSSDPVGNVPYSSWNIDQANSAVLNPVYGGPVHPAPSFYNPNQFANQNSKPLSDPFGTSTFPKTEAGSLSDCLPPVDVTSGYYSLPTISSVIPEPTGKATLSPVQTSVNPLNKVTQGTVPQSLENLAAGTTEKRMQYRPVYHHWFFRKEVESKVLWIPFSMHDSLNLEEIHNSNEISPETKVATDGGRYDVDILRRERTPVYWPGAPSEVRRCSWFYKGPSESRYTPYDESVAAKFEEEFKQACANNSWNRKIDLNNGEYIIFHSPTVQAHYLETSTPEIAATWANSAGSNTRPRIVKRGVDEFHIEDGEPERVDHLLFLVHGIGSVCDLKFRTVEEVVDEFRSISLQLVQSHYRSASDQGIVNRIEVLPISWHTTLHSEDTGIDKKLEAITLTSIPKLRHFTNDTLLDILFYTSPVYCQTIMKTVGTEMNRLFGLFNERNSNFEGNVYLGGHSLGSLIVFDLLCHQNPPPEENLDENKEESENAGSGTPAMIMKRKLSRKISYVMGAAGTGQPYIHYPQLSFHPRAFFAFGSPIGMFVTVRGIDTLGEDFALPTCPAFFNVFHPFDPVAYRVESLITPEAQKYRPKLIPHHKGRKRMHLELKETMARVGADLKQKLLDSVRSTWNSVYQLAMFHKPDNQALEREIDKVVEEQMIHPPSEPEVPSEDGGEDLKVGKLNGGRRIDYVLQEAPFEYINEYIFALTSHVCYWESEDTMLLILKEIYGSMGIQTDAQLPQNISIERVSSSSTPGPSSYQNSYDSPISVPGVDPTSPITSKTVGPPPTTGFVRKS